MFFKNCVQACKKITVLKMLSKLIKIQINLRNFLNFSKYLKEVLYLPVLFSTGNRKIELKVPDQPEIDK